MSRRVTDFCLLARYRSRRVLMVALLVLGLSVALQASDDDGAPQQDYPFRPIPFTAIKLADPFWAPRIEVNRTVTIPYAFEQSDETGRIENFKVAGGLSDKRWTGGFGFNDSDVSKIIEGAAYCLSVADDPKLRAYLDELIGYYAAAQEDDGFLYTLWTARDTVEQYDQVICRPDLDDRWSNIAMAHQLYNSGHMFEAGAAHYLATGDRSLLDVCVKNADLICDVFHDNGRRDPPGHQEIEIGLVKLYRATGERKYLDQAKFFLDQRGHAHHGRALYGEYSQDHLPVVEQAEGVGHAVRANYMYAGMADVAALTGDQQYVKAIDRIWENVVGKKLYVTGGVGATGHGEAYGQNYELPNRTAYAETCAAIANVYWNHRMFLLHGDAKYIDVLERSLYNGVISGVSLDGKSFFYPNPLASAGEHARSPWFGCACCPSNITRFLASLGGYVYAVRNDSVYVNLYVAGSGLLPLGDSAVRVRQESRYPWDGAVRLEVTPEQPSEFAIRLRIPGWARNEPVPSDLYRFIDAEHAPVSLSVNGKPQELVVENGFATVRRTWRAGDVVELNLPMPIRRVVTHDLVEANRGRVALQRGPLVYCVEHPDVAGGHVHCLALPDDAELTSDWRADLLGGVQVITGPAVATRYAEDGESVTIVTEPTTFTAIPYFAWAHRGRGEMAVWLARQPETADPLPLPTIAAQSRPSASGGNAAALHDQREPERSDDHTHPFLHWWPRKGTTEWVAYEFAQPQTVSEVQVYWFDDTGIGECRVPKSWKVLYRAGEQWLPVTGVDQYPVTLNQYDRVTFDPVSTSALRLEIQLQEGWAAGVHEWRVK